MSDRPPFESFVGEGLSAEEEMRLRRVHDLLLDTGAPPELPPALGAAPVVEDSNVLTVLRRYRFTALAAAAAVALVLFGAGYVVGSGGGPAQPERTVGPARPERTVAMTGGGEARARLSVFAKDAAGNWPMELEVEGLSPLGPGKRYELWLTENGKLAEQCGAFVVAAGRSTTVPLNAPYPLKAFTGWVVVAPGSDAFVLRTETV